MIIITCRCPEQQFSMMVRDTEGWVPLNEIPEASSHLCCYALYDVNESIVSLQSALAILRVVKGKWK